MCACADEPGEAVFTINREYPEALSSLKVTKRKDLMEKYGDIVWDKIRVRVETVDGLLHKWEFPCLDILCVDTEGTELDVLRGCDLERWRPKVVVLESWDDVSEADRYLARKGLVRKDRNVHNNMYVLEE